MQAFYEIRRADWVLDGVALRAVRDAVFVVEQKVPIELEWDDEDARSTHVFAVNPQHGALGTGRLLPDGHIGRMAVLQPWRRRGIASAMLIYLMDLAASAGHRIVRLHAQSYVVAFYEQHGFQIEGDEFMEAGIAHRYMLRELNPKPSTR